MKSEAETRSVLCYWVGRGGGGGGGGLGEERPPAAPEEQNTTVPEGAVVLGGVGVVSLGASVIVLGVEVTVEEIMRKMFNNTSWLY